MAGVVQGGAKLKAFVRKAQQAQHKGVRRIEVGFFSTARYSPVRQGVRGGQKRQPLPVTVVALWNEYGTDDGRIPERPFFRNAIDNVKDDVRSFTAARVNGRTMTMERGTAELVALKIEAAIKTEITRLRRPPNAPATIEKKGSANPLIDEGFLRKSVTHRVY